MSFRLVDKVADRLRGMAVGGSTYDGITASGSARQHNGNSHNAPQQNYGAPQNHYVAPQHNYSPPPQQNFSPPPQSHSGPQPHSNAPQQNGQVHNAPQQNIFNAPQHKGDIYNAPQHNGNVYNGPQHTGNVYHGPQHTGNITNNYAQDPSNPFAAIMASQGQPTPLHKACAKGDEAQVRSLLESGENIEAKDADFMTPLQVAVHKNRYNVACILIDHKANVEAQSKFWGKAQLPIFLAAANRNEAMVRLLVDNGADIEESGTMACGLTPLGVAAKNGAEDVVTFLLEKGAGLEAKDTFGGTPLYWAAREGHAGIVVKLLQHGASTNVRTRLHGRLESIPSIIRAKPQMAQLFKQASGQSG